MTEKTNIAHRISKPVQWLWRLFFIGLGSFILLIVLANFGFLGEMPSIEELQNPKAAEASLILADDGKLMGKVYRQDRVNVSFEEINPSVIKALIATEDERFFEHSGVDLRSLARSFFSFGAEGGASTITMQTAKNLFTEYSKNKLVRVIQKLKETIIAIKLERYFTKKEILNLYLNIVPFGDNVYGISNAAKIFFQKSSKDLTIDESAVLIGMLKASTTYNPRLYPEKSLARRNVVIGQMERNGFVSKEQAKVFKAKPLNLNYKKSRDFAGIAPYFRMVLLEQVKEWCKNNTKPDGSNYNVYKDGLKIYTTINPALQQYAEEAVSKHLSQMQNILNNQSDIKTGRIWKTPVGKRTLAKWMKKSDRWRNNKENGMTDEENEQDFYKKTPMSIFAWNKERSKEVVMRPIDSIKYHRQILQVGLLSMDPLSGAVKAWVGGSDFKTFAYDHIGYQTKRQVGSTIKPLLYCLAIDKAGFSPSSTVYDVQQHFKGFGNVPATGASCTGRTMSMKNALAWSRNCATAYILKQLNPQGNEGAKMFVDFLKLCGIKTNIEPYPSISLGSAEISLLEMVQAYSIFPGKGFTVEPVLISRIESSDGTVLFNATPKRSMAVSDMAAAQTVDMMQAVVKEGTGRALLSYGVIGDIAGKTGTTNDNSDAWFIGYSPQLVTGIWTGCEDRFIRIQYSSAGQGSRQALPIWGHFYAKAVNDPKTGVNASEKFNTFYTRDQSLFYNWVFDPKPDSSLYFEEPEFPFDVDNMLPSDMELDDREARR